VFSTLKILFVDHQTSVQPSSKNPGVFSISSSQIHLSEIQNTLPLFTILLFLRDPVKTHMKQYMIALSSSTLFLTRRRLTCFRNLCNSHLVTLEILQVTLHMAKYKNDRIYIHRVDSSGYKDDARLYNTSNRYNKEIF
jgi:hypothetical protein